MSAAIPVDRRPAARLSPPPSGSRAPTSALTRSGRWLFLASGAVAAAALLSASGLPSVFVGAAGAWQRESRSALSRVPREVSTDGQNGGNVVLIRPKAQGFKPDDEPTARELAPVIPGSSKQKVTFFDHVNAGYPVSEVFVRFEGVTPWKLAGEVVHETGDFEEAVRAQWPLLVERTYYLYRKVRFWLPTEHPIQFGYTNTNASIVPVTTGPLPEGTDPLELKDMLKRSGYLGAEKGKHWQHMHTTVKERLESKKDHHRSKPALPYREWNQRLANQKNYDPKKYKGRYTQYIKQKRGLVVGTGPSR